MNVFNPSDNEPPVRTGIVAASVISGDTSSIQGKRIIYVTLPAGKREKEKYSPDHAPSSMPASPVYVAEDKTSQYNEDWKSDVEITPRAGKRVRSSRIGQPIVVVLTVVTLLAAGIFIGLSINKDSLGFVKSTSLNNGKDKPELVKPAPTEHASQPLAVNSLPQTAPVQDPSLARDSITAATPAATKTTNVQSTRPAAPARERSTSLTQKTQAAVIPSKDSSLPATPAVHREASHRTDVSVEKGDKDMIRNNLSNLVSIGASGYTVGTFGGISDLQLTVSNHSVYSLDLVVVEVQYIQSNKKVFKTENLYFRGIAPGSALMQEAPKSSRGIKVQYKITLVNSKELGLSYSAL